MNKLVRNVRLSIDGSIVEAPIPLRYAFGMDNDDDDDELKCDYDIL